MRCEECLPLVEEYLDEELNGQTNDLMAEHLAACASCASAHRKILHEQELYLRYECDAQAAPAFWENVMAQAVAHDGKAAHSQTLRRRLSSFRGRFAAFLGNFSAPRFSPSLTALMVLIAIGVTAVVMSYLNPKEKSSLQANVTQGESSAPAPTSQTPAALPSLTANANTDEAAGVEESERDVNPQPQIAVNNGGKNRHALASKREATARLVRRPSPAERALTPDALIREAEQRYVAAIDLLSRDLNRRRSRLDAETAAQFERTLLAVDRTIADTRRAARKHPNDPVAAKYVLTAYAKKVDVLREMIGHD